MGSEFDPYSAPVSPTWIPGEDGKRFTVSNRVIREPYKIPREERALEITCGRSPIAVVYPRGRRQEWRLQLLDEDQHLLARDDPPMTMEAAVADALGEERSPDLARRARFKCVCGRMHVLDRDAIIEAAERLEPRRRSGPAPRIDFRRVAREVRDNGV